ncbi:MAG TPA: sulfotransferase [Rhizomicrobium sp.]|nr:sulfotransferase [Rhizomicrobium sp.]
MPEPGPDFTCIGMGKAGTGWLFDTLLHHPDFWMPPMKELHYLDHRIPKIRRAEIQGNKPRRKLERDRRARNMPPLEERDFAFFEEIRTVTNKPIDYRAYARLFRHKGTQLSGDVTPSYAAMEEELVAGAMGAFPKLKVIVLVRDPVARAWSHFTMKLRKNFAAEEDIFDPECLRRMLATPNNGAGYRASTTARRWRRHVPDEQFRVFFFDDLQAEPERISREILSFLGADPDKQAEVRHNRKADHAKTEMTPEVRDFLIAAFTEELRACAEVFGGPALNWPAKYGVSLR